MEYQHLVRDFATRTHENLKTFQRLKQEHPEFEMYEVTQLINSMLGLLVFPQQQFVDAIPETPLEELAQQGWPIPRVIGKYPQVENLNQLVKYLRNAIAHLNLEFQSDGDGKITGLRVWNQRDSKGGSKETTWQAELSIEDVERIGDRFTALLLQSK